MTIKAQDVKITIKCRAKIVDECADGNDIAAIYDPIENPIHTDSSWDGETIVCDACYLEAQPFMVMNGDNIASEITVGIGRYMENLTYVRAHHDPGMLLANAQKQVNESREGSPLNKSAKACVKLAEAELDRRRRNQEEGAQT